MKRPLTLTLALVLAWGVDEKAGEDEAVVLGLGLGVCVLS